LKNLPLQAQPFQDLIRLGSTNVLKTATMKKYLLLVLVLSGLMTRAQVSNQNGNCKAQFKYRVNDMVMSPIASTAINFDDRSIGNITAWFWDFGDGETSTEQNPFHVYIHPIGGPTVKMSPYRNVSLTILTSDSCKSSYSEMINIIDGTTYVNDPNTPVTDPIDCYINFGYNVNYNVQTLLPALTLDFYAKAVPFVTEWLWDFGDGETSNEQNPTHSFNLPLANGDTPVDPNPFRKVCLTVKTSADCTPSHCETIDLFMNTNPVEPPVLDCSARYKYRPLDTDSIAGKVTFEFNNYSKGDSLSYFWRFDNGLTSTEIEPKVTFEINQLPIKASLTVNGKNGCSDTFGDVVNLDRPDIYPPFEPYAQCQARFKAYRPIDVISIPEVIPFQFIDASEGKVVSWLWRFEDGSISTEASPLVNFDFMKPTQKVCLTVYTADSLSSEYCDVIYVSENRIDTGYITKPDGYYTMRVTGYFPMQMSSCAGTAQAQVYLNDSLVEASNYTWSTGVEGQDVKNLCPTQTYSVKAIAPDGSSVWSEFVFNSDGTVSEVPTYWNNWYLTGSSDNQLIKFNNLDNKNIFVEWHLCDGTIVESDSIPLELINCGGNESNMVMKDAAGNTVSTETISLKTLATGIKPGPQVVSSVKLFPNPVKDVLNIKYSGKLLNEMQIEIYDISGKSISNQRINDVESGQNISLNVNSLRNGIYLCKMISGKHVIGLEKFVK
jgi:PKD repeat protein